MAAEDVTEQWRPANLSFVMIRKDVWDSVIETYKGEYWNDNQEETEKGMYCITIDEYFKRKYDTFLKEAEEETNERMKVFLKTSFTGQILRDSESSKSLLAQYDVFELKDEAIEHVKINSFLSVMRKGWIPQPGAGSQSSEFHVYRDFYENMFKIAKKRADIEKSYELEDEE